MKKLLSVAFTTLIALGMATALPQKPVRADRNGACGWSRYIYNAGEPDNVIYFEGWYDVVAGDCIASSMRFNGHFSDGPMTASIYPQGSVWVWELDNETGIDSSFGQAFRNHMPALLTNPDDFDEGDRW